MQKRPVWDLKPLDEFCFFYSPIMAEKQICIFFFSSGGKQEQELSRTFKLRDTRTIWTSCPVRAGWIWDDRLHGIQQTTDSVAKKTRIVKIRIGLEVSSFFLTEQEEFYNALTFSTDCIP